MIEVGSDFSGVGAFEQALMRLGIKFKTIFACDMDKYARQTYIENYGEPAYYPLNVYDREIPAKPLDIYVTSPPCQSFSLAGKRGGEDDKRGILFYNSHEFIKVNKPRFFIFENVKGLLSDNKKYKNATYGKTFNTWIDMLGGKSVNGNPIIFPREDSVPYHIYHRVLNAKDYGVPQNRERVFIIGIRDDKDNVFSFPKPFPLTKRLKDVLEDDVDEKYFLSETLIKGFINHKDRHEKKGTGFKWQPKTEDDVANALRANGALCPTDNSIELKVIGMLPNEKYNDFSRRIYSSTTIGRTLMGSGGNCNDKAGQYLIENKVRRLTPRECFRLMDFPDTFKIPCSNTQMYIQAGNSIVVNVLAKIIKKLKL